jgi:viologen exporter family transport system permease protein
MHALTRYLRLWFAFARFGLLQELVFRSNFLVKMFVEALWLGLLLIFYRTIFTQTSAVATWTEPQYMFFVGCYFALQAVIEAVVLSNCSEFAELIRSGDLDFYLLRPIDEQFLVTCRNVDWSTLPNILMGICVMIVSLVELPWQFDVTALLLFLVLFVCGTLMAYSFLLMLTSASVWMTRNQSLFELWWLFSTLMRYPKEIFTRSWAYPLGFFFTFVVPVMLVINVPSNVMVRPLEERAAPITLAVTLGVTVLLFAASRAFFRFALRRYRSASS